MRSAGPLAALATAALLAGCTTAAQSEKTPRTDMTKDLSPAAVKAADEFLWLEDVGGERALTWVRAQNDKTRSVLDADPRFEPFRREALEILTAQDRTPAPRFHGNVLSNFWQDKDHVRGIWR